MNQLFNQIIQNQLRQNPNYNKVQEMIREAGGDPRTAFMNEAKRMGVDPQSVVDQAKAMLNIK